MLYQAVEVAVLALLEALTAFKNFLSDRPEWAFLAISMTGNIWLLKKLLAEKDAHFATVERWLPATEQLTQLLSKAAAKARSPRRTISGESPMTALPEGEKKNG